MLNPIGALAELAALLSELVERVENVEHRLDALDVTGARTRWLTHAEAAKHLRIHPSTLTRRVRQGRIPAYLEGGRRPLYDLDELEAYRREQGARA